jgi:Uma2 family endonuclease
MIEQGILTEDDKIELLEGELIKMSAVGPRHAACVERLSEYLKDKLGRAVSLRHQNPVELSDCSELEPDIAVIKRREDYYLNAHPQPDDVLLLVEVADTTLKKDRGIKLGAYARAGILEYWIVNLVDDLIEVYTNPSGNTYQNVRLVRREEMLALQSLPTVILQADEILG